MLRDIDWDLRAERYDLCCHDIRKTLNYDNLVVLFHSCQRTE